MAQNQIIKSDNKLMLDIQLTTTMYLSIYYSYATRLYYYSESNMQSIGFSMARKKTQMWFVCIRRHMRCIVSTKYSSVLTKIRTIPRRHRVSTPREQNRTVSRIHTKWLCDLRVALFSAPIWYNRNEWIMALNGYNARSIVILNSSCSNVCWRVKSERLGLA